MKNLIFLFGLILFSCNNTNQNISSREFLLEKRIDSLNEEIKILKSTQNLLIDRLEKTHSQSKSSRWKTNEPTWVDENGNRYTAEEIRKMRENDPDHIYRTTGQPVHSNDEIIDERIEERR